MYLDSMRAQSFLLLNGILLYGWTIHSCMFIHHPLKDILVAPHLRKLKIKVCLLMAGALGRPKGMGWGGRWEGGSGWGIHVNPWLIHVNVWQNPLQYCKVISLQLIKINGKKNKIKVPTGSVFLGGEIWGSQALCLSFLPLGPQLFIISCLLPITSTIAGQAGTPLSRPESGLDWK